MQKNLKWRFVLTGIVLCGALIYLVPSLTGNLPSWWEKYLPTDKVHLGLDLQGGIHLISESVNKLTYRQFNYGVLMSLESQLARWLHKRLSHNYTNASHMDSYEILLSTIERDSGLLSCTRTVKKTDKETGIETVRTVPFTTRKVETLEAAFDELAENCVLWGKEGWKRVEERRKGKQLIDILYCLRAHPDFIGEVKAANARLKQAKSGAALPSVDKSLPRGR